MVRKSVYGFFLIVLLINGAYAEENQESKDNETPTKSDEKSISKRGIYHVGFHGHPVVPHVHVSPVIPKTVITKVPTFVKPIVPAVLPAPIIPTTPYHITHGGATVTSYNANFPRVPVFTKTVIPPALPILPTFPHHHHGLFNGYFPHHHHFLPNHHHHHSFFPHDFHHHHSVFPHTHVHEHPIFPPHFHVPAKPIVPVAVPIPTQPNIPIFFNPKPVLVNPPKPTYLPVASPQPNPTFIPIHVPSNSHGKNPTIVSGISPTTSQNNNHINLFPTTQQTPIQSFQNHEHHNSQGNWQPIAMLPKPTQSTVTENCPPYNYHAALKPATSSPSNNFPPTNNFVSGQGPSVSQQLALYQQQQQYYNEQQNSFPYPAAAETFSQNYDAASNDGNYHGLSSYQVPLGVHK